jgi:hypothetical protein
MIEKLFRRPNSGDAPAIPTTPLETTSSCYVYTIKKSGSHLLGNILKGLGLDCLYCMSTGSAASILPDPKAKTSFVLSLERPSIRWRGQCQNGAAKIIFNLRDPRAVFLSLIDFYDWEIPLSSSGLHTVEFRRAACRASFKNREELAFALIEDEKLDDDPFSPWINFRSSRALYHNPMVLKVRYEEIARGATAFESAQSHPVAKICDYLGIECPAEPWKLAERGISENSITRNVGDPERWRRELSPDLLAAFMERHGDLVHEFGYST